MKLMHFNSCFSFPNNCRTCKYHRNLLKATTLMKWTCQMMTMRQRVNDTENDHERIQRYFFSLLLYSSAVSAGQSRIKVTERTTTTPFPSARRHHSTFHCFTHTTNSYRIIFSYSHSTDPCRRGN